MKRLRPPSGGTEAVAVAVAAAKRSAARLSARRISDGR